MLATKNEVRIQWEHEGTTYLVILTTPRHEIEYNLILDGTRHVVTQYFGSLRAATQQIQLVRSADLKKSKYQ